MGDDSGAGCVIGTGMVILGGVSEIANDEIITSKECLRYSYIGSVI